MNNIFHKITTKINELFTKHKIVSDKYNPWKGLSSYDDPVETENPQKFCGRERESSELYRLIDDNLIITLYGKSGIGKTSLLKAGVFPILRENDYFPLYIRLGANNDEKTSFAQQIINIITNQVISKYGVKSIENIDIIPENTNSQNDEYLWSFFARTRFNDNEGNTIFPVIILDQFEEKIRSNGEEAACLLRQIAYMTNRQNILNDTIVNDKLYTYEQNFRFVISIREDDLYRLEDLINANYLPSLRTGRYRLQNLSDESAKSIIESVGAGYFEEENIDSITKQIITRSKSKEDKLIQTNVISLICTRLYELTSQKGKGKITLQDVSCYLSNDPFNEYYSTATQKLSEGEKRYIETNLISADGRRNIISEDIIRQSIRTYENLIDGETPIFHRLRSSKGENLIELIHDGVCPTILKNRTIRLEKKNKTILSLCLLILGILAIWMLNTSVANNIAHWIVSIGNPESRNSFEAINILTVLELLFIFLCPLAVGSIIFDYKKKKYIAIVTFLLLIIPVSLYPKSCLNLISLNILPFTNTIQETSANINQLILDNSYVFIVYTFTILVISAINFFGKPGIKQHINFFKILWKQFSVRLYLFIIVGYLFYMSIFNSGTFIVETADSAWGIIIIPLLALTLFRNNSRKKNSKIAFYIYLAILISYTILSICNIAVRINAQIYCISLSLIVLFLFFYNNNFTSTFFKTISNVIILATVIMLHSGYNPLCIQSQNIHKVYPWKIVVTKEANLYGIKDAVYGDTLLLPCFKEHNSKPLAYYYTTLTDNSYFYTIKKNTIGQNSSPFPLNLTKSRDGKWKLSLTYMPNIEHAVCVTAHSKAIDNKMKSYKEAAKMYIKLRNDICKFCLSGNDSILLSDVIYINSYENTIKQNLNNALHQLSSMNSGMTEANIVPLLKALTQSFYMNILKESILKGRYDDFIEFYIKFYYATFLSKIACTDKITWKRSLNCDVTPILPTLDELKQEKIYAWNNLFNILILIECDANASNYYSSILNKLQQDETIIKQLYNKASSMHNKTTYYKTILEKQYNLTNKILNSYKNTNNKNSTYNSDDIIKAIINSKKISDDIKYSLPKELNSNNSDIITLTNTLKAIAYLQSDKQFEQLISDTFNSLIQIIKNDPINTYNGLFISICQNLYSVGITRRYDMSKFSKQMDEIERSATTPLYKKTREIESKLKSRTEMIDSISSLINSKMISKNQL